MSKLKLVPASKTAMLRACSFFVIAALSSGEAWAQSSEYDIGAQPLEQALAEFAQQEGLFLLNDIDLSGLQSPGVVGSYDRDEALRSLLSGTGLVYEFGDNGALVILSADDQGADVSTPAAIGRNGNGGGVDERYLDLETVVVTGTNIRGVENPTTPVLQFDREDIDLSGAATVEDFLRTIPQNFNSENQVTVDSSNPFTSNRNNFQGSVIDLRGLGAGSTLTLLNGRRMAASGLSSFVDVSVLPLGAIERVDVLTDGASAVYGSDAVGGVVNFITRKDYEGLDVNARYGTVTDGSKEDLGVGGAGGVNWGSGGGFVGVEYFEQTPLAIAERDFVDLAQVAEGANFGSDTANLSLAGALYQNIGPRLTAAVDILYSDRRADSNNTADGLSSTRRSDQAALFVNSRLEYEVSESLSALMFFDVGRNRVTLSDTEGTFDLTGGNLDNDLIVFEGQLTGQLLKVPGGDVSFSTGGLYREEEFNGFTLEDSADRNVTAFYGELLIPIIGDANAAPFIQRLELSAAGRYEDYSDFGDTFDPKIGLYWEVNDQLSFRGSYSESFRVPDLESINRPVEYIILAFPRSIFTAVEAPAADDRLLRPDEVVTILPVIGNPDLGPETAKTWSAGFSYEPSFLEGLSIQGNYFDIAYTNRLEAVSFLDPLQIPEFGALIDIPANLSEVQAVFAQADAGEIILSDFAFLSSGSTQPEDVQVFIQSGIRNLSRRDVRGVDINVRYETDTNFGQFSTGLNASYLIDFVGQLSETDDPVDQRNILYRPVDLNLRGNVSWSKDGVTAFLAVNHRDSYRDKFDESIANEINAWTTVDLSLAYDTGTRQSSSLIDNTRIGLSITNIFDEDPPFVMTEDGLNFDTANADPFGRQISFTIAKRF